MGRILLAVLVGLVGALIVHIGVIFTMPRLAEDNAWARLTAVMPAFRPTLIAVSVPALASPAASGQSAATERFGFMDPAFMTAACRFTVAEGPVRVGAENGAGFWSASINARSGDNVYSINERLAPEGRLDLVVGTQEQLETAQLEGFVGDEDSIPVVVTATEFYFTLRALVEGESLRPAVDGFARSLACEAIELAPAASVSAPRAG